MNNAIENAGVIQTADENWPGSENYSQAEKQFYNMYNEMKKYYCNISNQMAQKDREFFSDANELHKILEIKTLTDKQYIKLVSLMKKQKYYSLRRSRWYANLR